MPAGENRRMARNGPQEGSCPTQGGLMPFKGWDAASAGFRPGGKADPYARGQG